MGKPVAYDDTLAVWGVRSQHQAGNTKSGRAAHLQWRSCVNRLRNVSFQIGRDILLALWSQKGTLKINRTGKTAEEEERGAGSCGPRCGVYKP